MGSQRLVLAWGSLALLLGLWEAVPCLPDGVQRPTRAVLPQAEPATRWCPQLAMSILTATLHLTFIH